LARWRWKMGGEEKMGGSMGGWEFAFMLVLVLSVFFASGYTK
jgi:hypothetical protein